MSQFNTDSADSDDGFYGWVQDMLFTGVRLLAAVAVIASVVGFVCGLRSVGWI